MEETKEKVEETAAGQVSEEAPKSRREKKELIKTLKEQIEGMQAQAAKDKDDYIRLMAEFENFRRRSAAERLALISTASEKIIVDLLPLLDDCERAFAALGKDEANAAALEGTQLIYNKLSGVLKAKGLTEIEVAGKPFDADTMEAVAQFPAQEESQKGNVFDVVQKGYRLGDKIIRYAKVVVAQ